MPFCYARCPALLGGVPRGFAYDAAGNLLQDDRAAYTYDDFNRTVKAETFDGNIQINHYDAEGLRHEMEENGRLVQFIFNTEKEVVTETEGNVTNRLIRGSALIARTTDAECARTYYHYAADEMGSITHLTDEDGEVLNRYGYDAWGVSTVCEEQVGNRFRYTGEQFDAITKQYYLRARFYNPVVARFTQEDTYRGDGLNLYAYCANNPVGYVDPSGHQPQCVKDAAAKYMAEGLGKEEAYRKAYQNHAKQKLANAASLPVQERIKLEERARRLGLEVDSSVNREKNPEAKTPDAEQRDGRESGGRESGTGSITYGELDSLGRTTGIEATITSDMIGTGSPAKSSIKPAGFGGQAQGHARGHLLGNQLGGSGSDPRNLVTIYQNPVNHPVMSSIEANVRKAVEGGQIVNYKVTPIYEGNNLIPRGITLQAQGSGGLNIYQTILNRK